MTDHPKIKPSLLAHIAVIAVDQIMEVIRDTKERHSEDVTDTTSKAVTTGMVATSEYEMLKCGEDVRVN